MVFVCTCVISVIVHLKYNSLMIVLYTW